ncbi:hypothetical protein CTAYLR_001533 [Chrysophaeum taylorii]|uniref:Glycosyltransferase subfamily 4-like N-terminal domain-containing protein n=1 Tax=Chrysophaeum taylorii TaxID=2483200 RepID=A0AAD7XLT4_9STRA|nr:hypothetical protein CTAYLR_001533 [Chrysophaeum taylorii]
MRIWDVAASRRSRWNKTFVCLCVVCGVMLLREFIPTPSMVRPTRWIRYEPLEVSHARIDCPRWDGSPGGGTILEPKGSWSPSRQKRVFLYAIVAATAEAARTLTHFLDFYERSGIPSSQTSLTLQSSGEQNPVLAGLETTLDAAGVHYDVWIGTFSSETKAWHRERVVNAALEPDDWLVVADVDEFHQFPGPEIEAFVEEVERYGANYVMARWEDRVALDGELKHVAALDKSNEAETSLEAQFPLRCSMTQWTRPASGVLSLILPRAEDEKVALHKVYLRIHRSAHKIRWRSYFSAAPWSRRWPSAYGQVLVSRHFKWIAGLAAYLDRRVKTYDKCGMLWSYESASINARLEEHGGKICVACGELACRRAQPKERMRIAIVTSVWDEHVDGVSITMNRVARFLRRSDDMEVLVVTPHDPAVTEPVVDMSDVPKLPLASLPIFALVGRNDYVVGMPLGSSQKHALVDYDPDIYHLVSPDMLGYSARAYARRAGKCSVCSYHTQIDRYVRFYTRKHGIIDKLKPRIAVQKLFGDFYSGCDVVAVPNEAIASKLVGKMGIPRSKIGYFPRGVNTTQYNPRRRNETWRRLELDADSRHVVVLWAARLVKEKGADLFAQTINTLFKTASYADDILNFVRVLVVGAGPELDNMRKALPHKITTFLGHASGPALWCAYASADVYFFPSHTEAFPNTLLEAQASGLAVLAPGYSVNRDLVPRDSGFLVDEHAGPSDFADGLFELLVNTTRRRHIASRAVEVAKARTWNAAFSSLRACYDRCAQINAARSTSTKDAS